MKLSEAITRVDRSIANTNCSDIEDFAQLFDINVWYSQEFSERVKQHYLAPWYCTDSYVGLSVYYMDDEPVAVETQRGRKSDKDIEFVSEAAAMKIRDYILSLAVKEDDSRPPIVDLDEEIGDHYTVSYGSQLLTKTVIYNGEPVDIVTTWNEYKDIDNWNFVEVKLLDGTLVKVEMSELKIPFKLTAESTE